MPLPALTLRIPKGQPLTPGEMDSNFTKIRDFLNELEATLLTAMDEDGAPNRELLEALAGGLFGVATLSAGVYSVSLDPAPAEYVTGMEVWIKALSANTGAVDINVNNLGPKNILKNVNEELSGGEIPANAIVGLRFDGTNFQLVTQFSGIGATQLSEAARGGAHQYAYGTLNSGVYAVTLSPAPTSYMTGMRVLFKAAAANTGAVDINVNNLGNKNVFKNVNEELAQGDIPASGIVELVYDGSAFQLISKSHTGLFESQEFTIDRNGELANVAHGLGRTPTKVRWVCVCKTAEGGWEVGDEVGIHAFEVDTDNPAFSESANASNVKLTRRSGGNLRLFNQSTGSPTPLASNGANWRAKCYAEL